MLTRVTPALPEDLEALMRQTIGCCLIVHRELGCGLSESVYMRACRVELQRAGLHCESEKPVPVMYREVCFATKGWTFWLSRESFSKSSLWSEFSEFTWRKRSVTCASVDSAQVF